MVALAASKENKTSCASSSTSAHRHRSPLSPIHHNSSCARPPEHHTLALRRPAANPSRAPLPPSGVKSSPLLSSHLPRNLPLPRSPKPNTVCRKLVRDGATTVDLATRFKIHKEKDRTPAASTPRKINSLQLRNPPQAKRQTQLFVQQEASIDPLWADNAGTCNQKGTEHLEGEKNEKPCRRKWRRYSRESVLRSLRGGDAQGSFMGLAATDTERLNKIANPGYEADSSPKTAELVREPALNVKRESLQELSFDVYSGGKFSQGIQVFECVSANKEGEKQETETFNGSMGVLSGDKTLSTNMPIPGSPSCTHGEKDSVALTPPPARSLSLTPQAERSLTPPMQPTQSPDFIKREGARTLLPIDGTCYAAPCALVKDRRKCKPRGVLTIDAGQELLSSAESELGFVLHQTTQQMPIPAVASVEWMLEDEKNLGDMTSPKLASTSMDLCRMSFPKLSPAQHGLLPEQITDSNACEDLEDACRSKQGSLQQASFSISGYEWGTSSSQGMLSSYCTEVNSANLRRSIIFDDIKDVEENKRASAKNKSTIMHNTLFEEVPNMCDPSIDSSDEESSECLSVREATLLQSSPPFEYSLLNFAKVKEPWEVEEPVKIKQRSWSQCSPEEVMLSTSGPRDSPLSSQEHEIDGNCDASLIVSGMRHNVGALVINGGAQNFLHKGDDTAYDIGPQVGSDISARIAMARFLCNITATYLDDIATCLGTGEADVESERSPSKEAFRYTDNISLEHSSLMAGRKKMVECCSLLRGLTLETSTSRGTSSTASECSVNQPSPSANEDTADSLQTHVRARRHPRIISRFEERIFSLSESLEECSMVSPHACRLMESSQPSTKVPSPATRLEVVACVPNKGFIAGSYLLAGLFIISHTYYKHVKRVQRVV